MHLGGLTTIGMLAPANYLHFVLNNGQHASVGGQPTVALDIDLATIAQSSGYSTSNRARSPAELDRILHEILNHQGPHFVDIHLRPGQRSNLGRPKRTPRQARDALMDTLLQ